MREEVKKIIKDDYGNNHEYMVLQMGGKKAYKMSPKILRVMARVGGRLMKTFFDESQQKIFRSQDALDLAFNPLELGETINVFAEELENLGFEFLEDLLLNTFRTSESGSVDCVLSDFDETYRGNLGELIQAVMFTIDVNYGPLVRSRLRGKSAIIEMVKQTISQFGLVTE